MLLTKTLKTLVAAATALVLGHASAQELVVWHDLGDNGIKWFQSLSAEFAKTHPGASVKSVSYPTDQWFGRAISSINTDTAPDLLFNNYERVIRVADQTGKLMDLKPVLASLDNIGSAVRKDLDLAGLSERQKFFAAPTGNLVAYDFPEAVHTFYPELEAAYHRKLLGALASPPANWKTFIAETANDMRELAVKLSAKK